MSTPAISGLAGLVHGFTTERDRITKEDLDRRISQRDSMVQYLGHLASNPNIPPEHQQWALAKVQELIQHDPTKKLPKVDLTELPPAQVPGYTRQQTTQAPGMTLTPPAGPTSNANVPDTSWMNRSKMPSADVGRASDSTVNALGALQQPLPPAGYSGPMPVANVRTGAPGPTNAPGTVVGGTDQHGRPTLVPDPATQPNFNVAPQSSSLTLPAGPATTIQNPVPPIPISGKGELHVLTASDHLAYQKSAEGQRMNELRQQYPDRSQEELAYFAQHGEFPKNVEVSPGSAMVTPGGKEVYRNTGKKPGQKTGYSTKAGPSGEPVIIDNESGAELTPQEVEQIPEAKTLMQEALKGKAEKERQQEAKEDRQAKRQADQQARSFAEQEKLLREREEALSATTKSMVEAAPKVLKLSAEVRALIRQQEADLGPLGSRWSEIMSGKIGAPNEGFTRLRIATGLLQTLLMRMHVGARGGEHMMAHFRDMIDSGKQSPENMAAALDEIDQYANDVASTPKTGEGQIAAREAAQSAGTAPEGAEHEVYVDGKLVGHTVGGKYVPLGKGK